MFLWTIIMRTMVFGLLPTMLHAYPSGAPDDACVTMLPNHDVDPMSPSLNRYRIMLDKNIYMPNGTVKVTIQGTFKGLLVQARRKDSSDKTPIGRFSAPPANTQEKACSAKDDSWTHTNANEKTDITITWNSPKYTAGDIEFVATIVQVKQTFWTGLGSATLRPAPGYPIGSASGVHPAGPITMFVMAVLVILCNI